jgi:hypothetical protein
MELKLAACHNPTGAQISDNAVTVRFVYPQLHPDRRTAKGLFPRVPRYRCERVVHLDESTVFGARDGYGVGGGLECL